MTKKTKNLILILSIVLALIVLPVGVFLIVKYGAGTAQSVGNKANIEWYDENGTEFVISTEEELYGMIALSDFYDFKGQTIKLGADIVVNEGNATDWSKDAPQKRWYPISGFAGIFDGQGHTISGLYGKSIDTAMGLFSDTKRGCEIKNLKLLNSYFSGTGEGTGSISAFGGGTFDTIYSDAIIETKFPYAGGFVGQMNTSGEHKITNCWFDGRITMKTEEAIYGGCIAGAIVGEGSIVTIEHCLNTGSLSAEGTSRGVDVGGYSGLVTSGSVLYVKDSLNAGTMESKFTTRVGSLLGNIQSGSRTFTSHVYAVSECFGATMGYLGGNVQGSPVVYPTELLKSYSAYQWTTLDFEKYWAVVDESTPILQSFAEEIPDVSGIEKCYDISWYDEFASDFTISTLPEFYGFYILSANDNFEGKTIYLGNDLVVNEGNATDWEKQAPANPWYPINSFAGIFDGQGNTISGVYVKSGNQKVGLFSETTAAGMITNLRLENSYFESTATGMAIIGSVVGRGNGIIDTVYSNATIVCSGTGCGGIVGQVYTGMGNSISNCWFDGTIRMLTEAGKQCGGILGISRATVDIEHCLNTGSITAEDTKALRIGGIFGISASANADVTIRDCLSAGRIVAANSRVGAAVAEVGADTKVTMREVYATTESLSDGTNYINKAIGVINTDGEANGSAVLLPEKELLGTSAYVWTDLNFEKFWAAKQAKTPELLSFTSGKNLSVAGLKKKMDTSWYDEKATEYVINSVEDLYGFFMVSALTNFEGKTVKLGADLTVNAGNAADWQKNAPANIWYPINTFAGTFDGQGHTISGIYLKNVNQKLGLFSETTTVATVKNFRLANSYFESTSTGMSILGSVVGRGNGTIDTVYSDAIIVSSGTGNGGIVGQVYTKGINKITNCWFDGSIHLTTKQGKQAGGILGITRTDVAISHCLNTGSLTAEDTSAVRIGGILGVTSGDAFVVNMSDCLNAGTIVAANSRVGSIIAEVAVDKTINLKDVYATTESFSDGKKYINKTIGHTDKAGIVNGRTIVLGEAMLQGVGGYRWTTLDFDKFWVAKVDKTPELISFTTGANVNLKGVLQANTKWYESGDYTIDTVEELYGLVKLSLSVDLTGVTIKLGKTLDVNSGNAAEWGEKPPAELWVPIGSVDNPFAGTFDGQGYSITGIYSKTTGQYSGLFGATDKACVIKNLVLENSYFEFAGTGDANMGSIAGGGSGTFDTIKSTAILVSNGRYNGGIVGGVDDDSSITNCWFAGSLSLGTNAGQYGGGILGIVSGVGTDVSITHSLNSGKLEGTQKVNDTPGLTGIGGICGYVYSGNLEIDDTLASGEMEVVGNWQSTFIGRLGHGDADAKHAVATISNSFYSSDNKTSTRAVTIHGGTCDVMPAGLTLTGLSGIGGKFNTTLNFDKYWSAIRDKAPELQSFASGDALSVWKGEGTEEKPWLISNAEELKLLAEVASGNEFAGAYFELTADITVTDTENWVPIGNSSKLFAGHFDGKNKTISGIHYKGGASYIGLFGATAETAEIKNFKLANSSFECTATNGNMHIGSVAGYARGTFENIKVENTVMVTSSAFCNGGIIGSVWGGSATIRNCWFAGNLTLKGSSGRHSGAIVGRVYAANKSLVIEHCLNSGTVTVESTIPQIGGIVGYVQSVGTMSINDSLSAVEIPSSAATCGAIIGEVASGVTVAMNDVYGAKDTLTVNLIGKNGGTLTGKYKGIVDVDDLKGVGAYGTSLDFTDYWVALADKTPELKYFNKTTTLPNTLFDFNGSGTQKSPYTISSEAELNKLVNYAKSYNLARKYFKLTQDITIVQGSTPVNWTPIGSHATPFEGVFDGNGKTISGLYYRGAGTYIGLFGELAEGAVVKNLTLSDSTFEFTGASSVNVNMGSVAGVGAGEISKVKSEATVICPARISGGFFGAIETTATLTDCWFAGTLSLNSTGIKGGGFVGFTGTGANVTFTSCLNSGNLSGTYTSAVMLGGFVGHVYFSTVTISDSLSVGTITATNTWRGSVIGRIEGDTSTGAGVVIISSTYFNKEDGCEVRFNGVRNQSGTCTVLPIGKTYDELTGAKAANNADQLSFTGNDIHWVTTSKTPILKCFE